MNAQNINLQNTSLISDLTIPVKTTYRKILPKTIFPQLSSITNTNQPLTPKKYYPIIKNNGKVDILWTPKGKGSKNCIYGFKNTETKEVYVGLTSRKITKRTYEHNHKITKNDAKLTKFYKAYENNPTKFVFGIYPEIEGLSLADQERRIIKEKNSVKEGYNSNSGGGTGHKKVSSLAKKLLF